MSRIPNLKLVDCTDKLGNLIVENSISDSFSESEN